MTTPPNHKKADDKDDKDTPKKPASVVPDPPAGKGETRLFQRGPEERVWLTKEQAESEGHYWKETEEEKAKAKEKGKG